MLSRLVYLSILSTLCLFAGLAGAQETSTAVVLPSSNPYSVTLSISPIYFFEHGIGATIDVPVNRIFSVGIDGALIDDHAATPATSHGSTNYNWSQYQFTLHSQYMLTHNLFSDGYYVLGAGGVLNTHVRNYGADLSEGSDTSIVARASAGYQWVHSRVKYMLGLGYQYYQNPNLFVRDDQSNEVGKINTVSYGGAVIDASIGFNF